MFHRDKSTTQKQQQSNSFPVQFVVRRRKFGLNFFKSLFLSGYLLHTSVDSPPLIRHVQVELYVS